MHHMRVFESQHRWHRKLSIGGTGNSASVAQGFSPVVSRSSQMKIPAPDYKWRTPHVGKRGHCDAGNEKKSTVFRINSLHITATSVWIAF